jgi:hypothetical protein
MTIPDYELLRKIGSESYGEVWLGSDVTVRLRAVKTVRRDTFKTDADYEREFTGIRRYGEVAEGGPGLIGLHHVGSDDEAGVFHYVMDLADAADGTGEVDAETYKPRTLSHELEQHGRLPIAECASAGPNVGRGTGVPAQPRPCPP